MKQLEEIRIYGPFTSKEKQDHYAVHVRLGQTWYFFNDTYPTLKRAIWYANSLLNVGLAEGANTWWANRVTKPPRGTGAADQYSEEYPYTSPAVYTLTIQQRTETR